MFGIFSWIKIGAVVLIGLMIAAAYWHYTSLVKERDELMVRTALQQVELVKWEQSWEQMKAGLAEVERLRREAREYNDQITKLLAKHDLNKLAVAKPGLIEKRVNRATTVRLRVFECITDPLCTDGSDPPSGSQTSGIKPGSVDSAGTGAVGPVLSSHQAIREHGPQHGGDGAVDQGDGRPIDVVS